MTASQLESTHNSADTSVSKVWVLTECVHYESTSIISVHRTLEGAKQALATLVKEDAHIEVSHFSRNYRVESDGLTAFGEWVDLLIDEYEVEE